MKMSSLIVASYLDLMMLEISIEKLFVPRRTEFDSAILKKSVVMFRLLDKDWTRLCPHRSDYQTYHGSNLEAEPFNGGVSVVFAIPQSALEEKMEENSVDLQIHVHRELSEYFELESRENIGLACIDTCDLFNRIIGDIEHRNRKSIWTNKRPPDTREPISSSLKNTYFLMKEDGTSSEASVTIFLRITHLGPSIISEIEVPEDKGRLFYAQEESNQTFPYQCRELTLEELTSGCWGSRTLVPPTDPGDTCCNCAAQDELLVKSQNVEKEIPNKTSENSVDFDAESIYLTDRDAEYESDIPDDIGESDNYQSSGENQDDDNNKDKKKKKRKASVKNKPREKGEKKKKSKKDSNKVKSVKTDKQRKNTTNEKSAEAVNDTKSGTDTKAATGAKKDENIPNVKDARTVKFADANKKDKAENALEGIRRNQDRRDVKSAARGARNVKGVRRSSSRERNKKVRKHFEEEKWNAGNKYGGEKGSGGDRGAQDNREEEKTVSCLIKPSGCGRAGTCKLPDKKGKFWKCGKPDGEGGDPRKCGEKRKCARRRAASGTVTVGIAETTEQCIPSPCTPMERRTFAFSCHQCYPNHSTCPAHTDLACSSCYCFHCNRACTR